jgi:nitronate monooxygenase
LLQIPADYDGYMQVIAEERVAMVEIAGGSPKKYMSMLHEHGVKVLHKSATIRHALKAQSCGVDLIEVVGYEASIAGGQVVSHCLPPSPTPAPSQSLPLSRLTARR